MVLLKRPLPLQVWQRVDVLDHLNPWHICPINYYFGHTRIRGILKKGVRTILIDGEHRLSRGVCPDT
jgi:hypothetical protein